ncbi:MAG: hypothetical protein AAFN41_11575 [Planctomycetota bacterium]
MVARSTSGVNNINSDEIRSLILPLCSHDEQEQVITELDARLSVVDKIDQLIASTRNQAIALRQSILKRAFEGRLLDEAELEAVRSHPDYEPADRLLERIREQASAQKQTKKKTASKKTARKKRGSRRRAAEVSE